MARNETDANLLYFAIGISTFAILSFAFAAVENPLRQDRYTPTVILHATLMTAWLLLFVAQAALISYRQMSIHQALGKLSGLLVAVMVLNSIPVALNFHDDFGRDMTLYGDFALLIVFVTLYAFAVFNALKGRFEHHKRYVLVASVALVMPAFARTVDVFDGSRAVAAVLAFSTLIAVPLAYDWICVKRPLWVTVRAILFSVAMILMALAIAPRTG